MRRPRCSAATQAIADALEALVAAGAGAVVHVQADVAGDRGGGRGAGRAGGAGRRARPMSGEGRPASARGSCQPAPPERGAARRLRLRAGPASPSRSACPTAGLPGRLRGRRRPRTWSCRRAGGGCAAQPGARLRLARRPRWRAPRVARAARDARASTAWCGRLRALGAARTWRPRGAALRRRRTCGRASCRADPGDQPRRPSRLRAPASAGRSSSACTSARWSWRRCTPRASGDVPVTGPMETVANPVHAGLLRARAPRAGRGRSCPSGAPRAILAGAPPRRGRGRRGRPAIGGQRPGGRALRGAGPAAGRARHAGRSRRGAAVPRSAIRARPARAMDRAHGGASARPRGAEPRAGHALDRRAAHARGIERIVAHGARAVVDAAVPDLGGHHVSG